LSNIAAIAQVAISIDAQSMGNAAYGASRPDVCQAYPTGIGCPAANVGWTYTLNTAALSNGPHTLTVTITDSSAPALTTSLTRSFAVSNQAPPGAPQADDFNGSTVKTSLWTKQDAVGDATVSESGGHLQIAVPAGTKHDPYTSGNTGVEMMQAIADADFQVEAKFDSSPSNPYSSQGLMAQQDTSNYVRCDIAWISGLSTYSALLQGTSVSHAVTSSLTASSSYWLRLARQGNQWTCSVSTNGTSYTQVNQFTQTLTITKVGVWAGNAAPSGQTPPAYTALVDYFTPVTTTTIYQPDEFNGSSVNTSLWTKQDAIGDGTLSESGGELHISVPAGVKHDPYTSGNTGVEVLQSVANGDFQVEAKFDSALPATGEQGLMAMQDVSTYIRCDLIGDGTYVNTYSAFLSGTSVSHAAYTRYSIASSYWLRLARQGNTWTCSVSTDGTSFSQVNQFTQSMTLTKIGPWAGNQSAAFTALVDYVH
jgi:regulation of enolase protein 1 (concanavalin A-like superfamily)